MNAPLSQLGGDAALDLQRRVSAFVRVARDNGYAAGMAEEIDAQRLLLGAPATERQNIFWALRALLCSDPQQWQGFAALFEGFWDAQRISSAVSSAPGAPIARRDLDKTPQAAQGENASEAEFSGRGEQESVSSGGSLAGASAQERLAGMDFQFLSNSTEQREIDRLVLRLAQRMKRTARRRHSPRRRGCRLDFRRTLRRSLSSGGVPLQLAYRVKRRQQPKLILIVDVSRSMSIYSTVFLRFARALISEFAEADVFAFHTRLIPITEALRKPDLLEVKHHLSLLSSGWSGGTRLGECLQDFERRYGRRVSRRSSVIIVSDGLDTGEPEDLVAALQNIRANCRRLIWLNPLLGRPGYEVKTRSMQAALPLLDLFAPAHNLRSLQDLEPQLMNL